MLIVFALLVAVVLGLLAAVLYWPSPIRVTGGPTDEPDRSAQPPGNGQTP